MKKCFKCNEVKPLADFYKHKEMKDGRLNKCKECTKKDVANHRQNNIEKIREYDRSRSMLPHRVKAREEYSKTKRYKESCAKSNKRYKKENPIKYKAHTAVGNAVRDGVLIKPTICECCSIESDNLHGHHDDYSKPLDVRWLCPRCHIEWHRENGEALNG